MDFLSNLKKSDEPNSKSDDHEIKPTTHSDHKPSNSDLLNSCKIVADAAKSHLRNEPDKYDKAKVAAATADLLDAAEEYGKIDHTKGVGKYVDQAEDYLRNYGHSSKPVAAGDSGGHKHTTTTAAAAHETNEPENKSHGEGGAHKPSGGGDGAGSGDFMKNFLKN